MNRPLLSIRAELKETISLAFPIVLSQVGHMFMGIVDTMIAGKISTAVLAGVGLGATLFWNLAVIFIGVLLAMDTFSSQAVGAKDEKSLAKYFVQALWLALVLTVICAVVILSGQFIYQAVAPASETKGVFSVYVLNVIWSLPAIFLFFVLQRYWQARKVVIPFTLIIILANVGNLLVALALGLGWWGFPRLEGQGIALATVINRGLMVVVAVGFTVWKLKMRTWHFPRLDWQVQKEFLHLGLPAGGQTALEVGVFTIVTFIVGFLGAVPLAAHHVCINVAAFTFMFSLGLSSAAAVRVGTFVGARELERAKTAGWLCVALSVFIMGLFAIACLAFPTTIMGWFSHDPAVIQLGTKILLIVALFQIGDGIQVTATGALRGLGNTRSPMIANFIGHFPIGLAVGLFFCYGLNKGVVGLWIGLATGLVTVAFLVLRAWMREIKSILTIELHAGENVIVDKTPL